MSAERFLEQCEPRVLCSGGTFLYAVSAGGIGKDRANDVASDRAGDAYVCGVYNGPVDFDPSSAIRNLPGTGTDDAFIAKYGPGGHLLWARAITGAATQEVQAIAVDASGNVYATGYFDAAVDFDPGSGVHELHSKGAEDAFVLKLSSSGAFDWVRQFSGSGREGGVAIATDASSNVYVQGMYNSTTEFGAETLKPVGGFDDFLVKLTSTGAISFVRSFGGAGDEFANGIAVARNGQIVTTGTFTGKADFDPGIGVATLTSAGDADVFISRVSAVGNFLSADRVGGRGDDVGGDVALDSAGNIYSTGRFSGTVDFDPGSGVTNLASGSAPAAFIIKLAPDGALAWARKVGGGTFTGGNDLAVDAGGSVYVTGAFGGTVDFNPGAGVSDRSSERGSRDIFVEKLSTAGTLVWANTFGSFGSLNEGEGVALASGGGVFVAGSFGGRIDFNPSAGTSTEIALGAMPDLFLAEYR